VPQCAHALPLLLCFAFSDLGYFAKVMACYSPLDEVTTGMMKVENMDKAVVTAKLERSFRENPTTSDAERRPVSPDAEDILSESGSGNENLHT
jgi:hypothetical protein